MPSLLKLLWPDIVDHASARKAVQLAYYGATVLSVVFFFTAFLAVYTVQGGGVDHRLDFVDAAVFMIVGWLLKGGGRKWCITGLVFCLFEACVRFSVVALPAWILLLILFTNGVRGATGLLRFPAPPAESPAP